MANELAQQSIFHMCLYLVTKGGKHTLGDSTTRGFYMWFSFDFIITTFTFASFYLYPLYEIIIVVNTTTGQVLPVLLTNPEFQMHGSGS